jgi:hypothetical protein
LPLGLAVLGTPLGFILVEAGLEVLSHFKHENYMMKAKTTIS